MAGENNLIPLDRRTEDEQRKIQSMGGVASGAARRRRKALREAADTYLSLPVADRRKLAQLARAGVDPDDADIQMLMIAATVQRAIGGDVRAAKLIFDLLGTADSGRPEAVEDDPITRALREEFGNGAF